MSLDSPGWEPGFSLQQYLLVVMPHCTCSSQSWAANRARHSCSCAYCFIRWVFYRLDNKQTWKHRLLWPKPKKKKKERKKHSCAQWGWFAEERRWALELLIEAFSNLWVASEVLRGWTRPARLCVLVWCFDSVPFHLLLTRFSPVFRGTNFCCCAEKNIGGGGSEQSLGFGKPVALMLNMSAKKQKLIQFLSNRLNC